MAEIAEDTYDRERGSLESEDAAIVAYENLEKGLCDLEKASRTHKKAVRSKRTAVISLETVSDDVPVSLPDTPFLLLSARLTRSVTFDYEACSVDYWLTIVLLRRVPLGHFTKCLSQHRHQELLDSK